jgi:hypothetical protein
MWSGREDDEKTCLGHTVVFPVEPGPFEVFVHRHVEDAGVLFPLSRIEQTISRSNRLARLPHSVPHFSSRIYTESHSIRNQPVDPPLLGHPHIPLLVHRPRHQPLSRRLAVPDKPLPLSTRQHGESHREPIHMVPKVFPGDMHGQTDMISRQRGEVSSSGFDKEGVPESKDETRCESGSVVWVGRDDFVHQREDFVGNGKDLDVNLWRPARKWISDERSKIRMIATDVENDMTVLRLPRGQGISA